MRKILTGLATATAAVALLAACGETATNEAANTAVEPVDTMTVEDNMMMANDMAANNMMMDNAMAADNMTANDMMMNNTAEDDRGGGDTRQP